MDLGHKPYLEIVTGNRSSVFTCCGFPNSGFRVQTMITENIPIMSTGHLNALILN